MCKLMEELREEGLAEGMEIGVKKGEERTLCSNLKMLMEKLGYTVQQAMDVLDVSPEVRTRLAAQMNA